MGQTLTHGIYLPDEGERNCYNGLAANWQLLDGAVGTVAEHTSALAGKAPLVHTHTKSDITDFPAYGNAAGTICEGNDSRLSDARTPVAHTHTKSDVTDLFNSANTWTGDNTFSKAVGFTKVNATTLYAQNARVELGDSGLSGDTYTQISFADKNGDNFGYLRQTYGANGNNGFHFFVRNKFLNDVPNTAGTVDYAYFGLVLNADKSKEGILKASFRPYDNNTYDLGSSSYQWNNLYAKNYFYNGVAWGLDKQNEWTNFNRFNGYRLEIKQTSQEIGVIPESNQWNGFNFVDKNKSPTLAFEHAFMGSGETRFKVSMVDNYASYSSNTTVNREFLRFIAASDFVGIGIGGVLRPLVNNAYDLGTSTNKWKTLNGINPGALSFPNYDDTTYIDISGSIVPPSGETEINKSLGSNQYTPPIDGWLSIRCDGAEYLQIYRNSYNCPGVTAGDGTGNIKLVVTLPVRKNVTYSIRIKKTITGGTEYYQLYPCQGNV